MFITAVVFSFIFLNEGYTLRTHTYCSHINTVFFCIVNSAFDDSKAGLAISQSLILTGMVQMGSQQVTEVINQMTSVERILEYTKLEKERSLTVVKSMTI